jgi:hypothetical protein
LPDAYESYAPSGRTARAGARDFANGTTRRRGKKLPTLKELGIKFAFEKNQVR